MMIILWSLYLDLQPPGQQKAERIQQNPDQHAEEQHDTFGVREEQREENEEAERKPDQRDFFVENDVRVKTVIVD